MRLFPFFPKKDHPRSVIFRQALFFQSRESIILFCWTPRHGQSVLMEYSLKSKRYNRLDWSIVSKWTHHTIVSTLDERYIVLFGKHSPRKQDSLADPIIVFDLRSNEVFQSNIKCPVFSYYYPVVLGSHLRNELISFGFVRQAMKASIHLSNEKVPCDIMNLISRWYCKEEIHLIAVDTDCNSHWKIDMDEIIQSIQKNSN